MRVKPMDRNPIQNIRVPSVIGLKKIIYFALSNTNILVKISEWE